MGTSKCQPDPKQMIVEKRKEEMKGLRKMPPRNAHGEKNRQIRPPTDARGLD